jgi:hypothetical protein
LDAKKLSINSAYTLPATRFTVLVKQVEAPPPGADQFPHPLGIFPLPQGSPPVALPQVLTPGSLAEQELIPVEPVQPLQLHAIEFPLVVHPFGSDEIFHNAQS